MNVENKLGKKIKQLRKSMGLTQEQLAEYANIDDKHLSKIENGLHLPSYRTLKKISETLNFNLQDIDIEPKEERILNTNPLYLKSLKILNSAKSEHDLVNYYKALQFVKNIMKNK